MRTWAFGEGRIIDRRTQLFGIGLALLAGIFLGSAVAVARFAYDGGASGIVVAGVRTVLMTFGIALVMTLAGRSLALPRELLPVALFNGALMSMMTYGNIGAVEFISVGLTALLFFTFPIIIAVIVTVFRIEPASPAKLFAILLAFFGLVLMLGSSAGDADWRGVALALAAAVCTAVNGVLVARHFGRINAFVITFHFSWTALIVLVLIGLLFAEVRFPTTDGGWAGVAGVAVLQASAMPMYLYALSRIGALKAGMFTNVQPVTSIFEAWVLFDEVLSLLQALGGAIVLGSIGLMQWADIRRKRQSLTTAVAADQMPAATAAKFGEKDI
ncbi:DMT family transporter [Minwuia sp.]|uniref:DMT family transporter n=1 Tax=Minwuia sp. TaxID=2493630 RepID=UPI003A951584